VERSLLFAARIDKPTSYRVHRHHESVRSQNGRRKTRRGRKDSRGVSRSAKRESNRRSRDRRAADSNANAIICVNRNDFHLVFPCVFPTDPNDTACFARLTHVTLSFLVSRRESLSIGSISRISPARRISICRPRVIYRSPKYRSFLARARLPDDDALPRVRAIK